MFSLQVTDSLRALTILAAAAAAFAALTVGAFAAGAGFFDIDDIHGVFPTDAADCR